MRKSEYASGDHHDFEFLVTNALVGYLGILTQDGYPRVIPMNFAADGKIIYFHGATFGEKHEALKSGPKVTFSIDIPYSVIPSHWTSKISAGAATMLYKSTLIKGRCRIVDDVDKKVHALQLITNKYQPDGGYRPITADEPTYNPLLKNTAVFRIDADHIDIKVNFRQRKNPDYKKKIIRKLEERSQGPDLATAEILRKLLPQKKK